MGLDLIFVNPANVNDKPLYKPEERKACNNVNFRIIGCLPYIWQSSSEHKGVDTPYTSIRSNSGKTVADFRSWLVGLREWILDNRNKYIYLMEPKYDWQRPFYTSRYKVLFGDITVINSPNKPSRKENPTAFAVVYSIYRNDDRPLNHYDMIHDAMIVQNFIDYLEDFDVEDNWILEFDD